MGFGKRVGNAYWQVYENNGEGFELEPYEISITALDHTGIDDLLDSSNAIKTCGNDLSFRSALVDLDGHGVRDIVRTNDRDAQGVGTDVWRIDAGTCE